MTCKNEDIGAIMRIYMRDLEKMKTWQPPKRKYQRETNVVTTNV